MLFGLFPPQGQQIWDPTIAWQPIPVHSSTPNTEDLVKKDSSASYLNQYSLSILLTLFYWLYWLFSGFTDFYFFWLFWDFYWLLLHWVKIWFNVVLLTLLYWIYWLFGICTDFYFTDFKFWLSEIKTDLNFIWGRGGIPDNPEQSERSLLPLPSDITKKMWLPRSGINFFKLHNPRTSIKKGSTCENCEIYFRTFAWGKFVRIDNHLNKYRNIVIWAKKS